MPDLTDEDVGRLIAEHYGEELSACTALLDFGFGQVQHWSGRPVKRGADRIIVFEAARATKTFDAIIRLGALGFGEQAVMLNRSLFEGMAVAHWVAANRREAVGLFTRHANFSRLLWWETLQRLGWLEPDERKPPGMGPKRRAEFVALFGGYGARSWTRRTVPSLIREIEDQWDEQGRAHLRAMHDVANRHANQVLHSTPYAASATATGATGAELRMTIGASDQFLSQALLFAHWNYGQVLSLLIKVFKISSRDEFRAIWDRGFGAFSRTPQGLMSAREGLAEYRGITPTAAEREPWFGRGAGAHRPPGPLRLLNRKRRFLQASSPGLRRSKSRGLRVAVQAHTRRLRLSAVRPSGQHGKRD